jgi:hypothetical protein
MKFGKYTLIERLGRGGMAEVWKAEITGPAGFSRTLVVKRILPHLAEDPQFVEMFVREARLSARLHHGSIVQVFELGDVDGEYFLAMEYVRGRDLHATVRAQLASGPPPPGMATFVVLEVCRALAHAHALTGDDGAPLRLIHRDVSPSNVMLSFDGAVKLLDFGIAKALSEADAKTQSGTLKGKFSYLSPEQVEGREVDHRADLFAVGVVLHEALTGRRLFKGSSDLQTLALVRAAQVDPPSRSNPNVPPELDRICLRALARDLEQRYPSCDDMAADLEEMVHALKWGPERLAATMRELFPDEGTPTAEAELAPTSLQRLPRRRPRKARVALSVLVALALGGVGLMVRHRLAGAPSAPHAVSPAPVELPAPPALEQTSPTVQISISSRPAGASVYLGDDPAPKGKTPVTLSLARSGAAQHITLRAPGYEPGVAEVMPDADSRLQLALSRVPPRVAAAPARPPKHGRPKTSAPPRANDRGALDLRRGDTVDPFAR